MPAFSRRAPRRRPARPAPTTITQGPLDWVDAIICKVQLLVEKKAADDARQVNGDGEWRGGEAGRGGEWEKEERQGKMSV